MVRRTLLPATPGSVAAGRRYARDVLVSRDVEPPVVETVELLTSEIMTYALRTARGARQELRIELAADQVCVQVSDSLVLAARRRVLAGPQGQSRTLIETLAGNWGLVVEPQGRHLWFTVARPREAVHGPQGTWSGPQPGTSREWSATSSIPK